MKTPKAPPVPLCPTVEELEKLPLAKLVELEAAARLAIAKPYFADRLATARFLREGK